MAETILQFDGVSKSFFGVHALHDVTFSLPKGHLLGLIGENGAGKSTLMNILGGVVRPDSGGMTLRGQDYSPRNPSEATEAGVAFIHQELNLFRNLSIADNLFIDRFPRFGRSPFIHKRAAKAKARQLLESLNLALSPDTLVDRLTPGERQLVEIAKALSTGAEIIIFDEPTTSLTAGETERLFRIIHDLRRQGKSMIYISHNLGNVLELADEIVVLRDGRVVDQGPKDGYTVDRMISRMVGRDISQVFPLRQSGPMDEIVLEVRGVSMPGIVKDVDLTLHKGEVLGLFGLMGSGRTELARILFGLDSCEQGRIIMDGVLCERTSANDSIRRGMAFVTENRREEGLLMEATIVDNIGLVSLPAFARPRPPRLIRGRGLREAATRVAESLRIKGGPAHRTLARNLSGGNQQKVVIGKWLLSKPKVFILDEPTRGIDVGAKCEVYAIVNDLAARGAGILLISSEIEELMGMCDRILVMSKGQIQGAFNREEFDREQILHAAFQGRQIYPRRM
ncbi:MAG TPA: sugar ABC transporter ATP-binding protein [Sedimentisphaerales bacterium]|nr:sugar ABC transporter ATP-binding protein [Phycisphaerae bacterium]HQI27581.1 sugar ABC transporter ATP-binding protein [Sedimentisphaerales bacterium]